MADFGSSITAFFGGDTSGLEKAVASAQGTVGAFSSALGKIGLTIGAGAVLGFFKSVIDNTSKIKDMADSLDVGTDALQALEFAFKKAGGRTEDVQKVFQNTRKATDDLAIGNETAIKTFAKLGLSQQDLIGIPLEQQLEKISAAFVKNKETAGTYGAITDIVGMKSAKLLGSLQDLGMRGFGGLERSARDAGVLIEKEVIDKIDDMGDRLTEAGKQVQAWGAQLLGGTADFIAQTLAEIANLADGIETIYAQPAEAAKRAAAAMEDIGMKIKGQVVTVKELAVIQDKEAKLQLSRLEFEGKSQEKINELRKRSNALLIEAINHSENTKERAEGMLKVKEIELEIDKEIAKNYVGVALADADHLRMITLIAKQKKGLTEDERVELSILKDKNNELKIRNAIEEILALSKKGTLLPMEQEALLILQRQLKVMEDQIAAKMRLANVTQTTVVEEKKVTEELSRQHDLIKIMAGIATSKNFGDDETVVLEERKRRNESKIQDITRGITSGPLSRGANLVDRTEVGRLTIENQNLQRELDLRRKITSIVNTQGEGAALRAFPGDPRDFDRFLTLAEGQDASAKLLQKDIGEIKNLLGVFRR